MSKKLNCCCCCFPLLNFYYPHTFITLVTYLFKNAASPWPAVNVLSFNSELITNPARFYIAITCICLPFWVLLQSEITDVPSLFIYFDWRTPFSSIYLKPEKCASFRRRGTLSWSAASNQLHRPGFKLQRQYNDIWVEFIVLRLFLFAALRGALYFPGHANFSVFSHTVFCRQRAI